MYIFIIIAIYTLYIYCTDYRVFLDVDQDQVDNTDTLDITGFNSYF